MLPGPGYRLPRGCQHVLVAVLDDGDLLGRPVPCAPFVLRDVVQASVKMLAATAAAFQVSAQRGAA